MLKFAVMGSGRGSSFQKIFPDVEKMAQCQWQLALSDQIDAQLLQYARQHDVTACHLSHRKLSREVYGQQLIEIMKQHQIDFILLVGFMRILSAEFVQAWSGQIYNVHPSLLPRHKGLMDKQVHQAVLDNNESKTGCSVHLVTPEVDEGRVILQKQCAVERNDTVETLKTKVQSLEAESLLSVIQQKVKQYHEQSSVIS
jgi:phosphoribosylglycinamide formyltransferase-1